MGLEQIQNGSDGIHSGESVEQHLPYKPRRRLVREIGILFRRRPFFSQPALPEMPNELTSEIASQTPARVLRREERTVGIDSGIADPTIIHEEQRSRFHIVNGFKRVGEVIKTLYRKTNDPLYWAATYMGRGGFWPKVNAFFDHPEGRHQQHIFKWALRSILRPTLSEKYKKEDEPTAEPLTFSEAIPLFIKNRLYRQTFIYLASFTPIVGPLIAFGGLHIENIGRAVGNREWRKVIQYGLLSLVDVAPTIIAFGVSLLKAFVNIPTKIFLRILGGFAAANVGLTIAPTNSYRNEPYQEAYTEAHVSSLLTIADYFMHHDKRGKGQAIVDAINSYLLSSLTDKEKALEAVDEEIAWLEGNAESEEKRGRIEVAKEKYENVKKRVAALRYPTDPKEKRRRIPLLLHTQLDYFEREIISLEERLAVLHKLKIILEGTE